MLLSVIDDGCSTFSDNGVLLFRAQQEEEVHIVQELRAALTEKEQLLEVKDGQALLLQEEKDKAVEEQQEVRRRTRGEDVEEGEEEEEKEEVRSFPAAASSSCCLLLLRSSFPSMLWSVGS